METHHWPSPRAPGDATAHERHAWVRANLQGISTIVEAGAEDLELARAIVGECDAVQVQLIVPDAARRESLIAALAETPTRAIVILPLPPPGPHPALVSRTILIEDRVRLDAYARDLARGAPIVLTAPLGAGTDPLTLSRAAARLSSLGRVDALFVRDGFVHAAVRFGEPPTRENLEPHALLARAEEALLELVARQASERRSLETQRESDARRSQAQARRLGRSMRAILEQNLALRAQVERTRASARYRLGSALIDAARPSTDALRLPRQLLDLYQQRTAPGRVGGPGGVKTRREVFETRFALFEARARASKSPLALVSYTGTRHEGVRANRPFALARVLRARGVPVIFGYHGDEDTGALPSGEDPLFLELPETLLSAWLPRIARLELSSARRVLSISHPTLAVARALNTFNVLGWTTVYDALDDWEAFARASVGVGFSPPIERSILANVDLITAVSRPLAAKLVAMSEGREVFVSPNALDPTFVDPIYRRRPAQPPKVGYFGHLTPAWFDFEAISAIARLRPALEFELIGHGAPTDLALPRNIHLLGPKPPNILWRFAESWSAGLIPFKMGALADAVDPIKIYEYLALGLPTVSFRMPQIADYPATETVEDVDAFVRALDRALVTPPDPRAIRAFLESNTWPVRADALLAAIDTARPYTPRLERREESR